ncbi:MAG: GNAT family N-acetyltransferase, partial [bacterium]|nr:GNAT family N-acetyltransferase [bacterium]
MTNETIVNEDHFTMGYRVMPGDPKEISELARRSSVFSETEIEVAGELADDVISGKDTSYLFCLLRNEQGHLLGYTCYGEIPLTERRFDLYWIVVDPEAQRSGLAAALLAATEDNVRRLGGVRLYAETSGTAAYAPARAFYLKNGFSEAGRFVDFYRDGDDKVVFCKVM